MHEEGTTPDDPTLRALQIFVRPHTVDLEPNIQFKEISTPPLNDWRLLAGPEDTEAPSFIPVDRLGLFPLPFGVRVRGLRSLS